MYSKTGKVWSNDYEFTSVGKLPSKVDLTKNDVVYYHHPYDNLFHQVSFVDAIDPIHFEHIRSNPTVTLVHENSCEAIDARFAEEVYQVITKQRINPSQVKVVAADENHKNFLKTYLESRNVFNTNIVVHNYLLSKVDTAVTEGITTKYKFSSLSRNYKDWRLLLYKGLVDKDLLQYFLYSFHNIWPYTEENKIFTVEQMVTDLENLTVKDFSKAFLKWLKRCPHDLDLGNVDNVKNKWSNITYDAILSADFHLMIETHFDQRSFTGSLEFDRTVGPSSITEKAYKVIACSRPFITFATPYFLEDIRGLGYKTFAPYINESYDTETDNHKRLNMIVDEVNRICNLSENDYAELVSNCKGIAEFNRSRFEEHKRNYKHDS